MKTPDKQLVRYVIYARVSSDRQDVKNSINAQVSEGKKYIQAHDGILVKIFVDESLSGREENRPGFLQMIEEATQPSRPFDVILVWEYSRFFRNRVKSAVYKQMIRSKGVEIASITQPKDDSPAGDLAEAMFEAFDAFQSATQGVAIRRGMRELAALGFWMPSRPPMGYRFKRVEHGGKLRRRLEIDPQEEPAIRALWDLAKGHKPVISIARGLNGQGFRTRDGKKWTGPKVHRALQNEAYIGTVRFGSNHEHIEPAVQVENAHEPYVDKATFDKINAAMAERAPTNKNPRETGSIHLMSGKAICVLCGAKMRPVTAKGGDYHYYTCKTRTQHGARECDNPSIPKDLAEWLVMDAIIEDILTDENMMDLIAMIQAELESKSDHRMDRVDALDKEISKLNANQSRLVTALETADNPPERILARIEELEGEISNLRRSRAEAEAALGSDTEIAQNPGAVIAHCYEISRLLCEENIKAVKHLFGTFVKCVWFEPNCVTIEYAIPLPDDSPKAGVTRRRIGVPKAVRSTMSPSPATLVCARTGWDAGRIVPCRPRPHSWRRMPCACTALRCVAAG